MTVKGQKVNTSGAFLAKTCLEVVSRDQPLNVIGQHVRHAAAERVIDPAGAAGRDGDVEPLIGSLAEGRTGHRRRAHRERADDKSFAFHDGRPLPIARRAQISAAWPASCAVLAGLRRRSPSQMSRYSRCHGRSRPPSTPRAGSEIPEKGPPAPTAGVRPRSSCAAPSLAPPPPTPPARASTSP